MNRSCVCLTLALAFATLVGSAATARADDPIHDLLSAYVGANAEGYFKPFKDAVGSALNTGLYSSGRVPKSGFHVRLEARGMLVKFGDSDKTFQAVTQSPFPAQATFTAPTVVGSTNAVTYIDPSTNAAFPAPGGIDLSRIALGAPQVVLGSVAGTEAIVRYFAINTGNTDIGDVKLFGIGGRHSISQYFGNPPIDVAAMIFFQSFKLGSNFVDSKALTYGVQASKQLGILEPYVGFGLDSFKMDVDYTFKETNERIKIKFDRTTHAHLTLGSALHFGVLHLSGELNVADQTGFTAGLGIGR